jgi:hypothetical protein
VLLDLMSNNKLGMSYPFSRFNTDVWTQVSSWSRQPVRFQFINEDSETRTFDHIRTQFDCILEGRPVAEQLVDVCRAGRVSIPFQNDSQFEIAAFRAFTTAELAAAPVFTDSGQTKNILWIDGEPSIQLSQIPNDKLINDLKMTFEDGSNGDAEDTVNVNDPNQQLLAGRALGGNNLKINTKNYSAFGCRNRAEVVKLGYGILRFGEFDEGGTLNNWTLTIQVPLVEALGIKRYDAIKVVSALLDGKTLPGDGQVEFFRVRSIKKTSKDTAIISAQGYNHTAYIAFETLQSASAPPPGDPPDFPPLDPPADAVPDAAALEPEVQKLTFGAVTFDPVTGIASVEVLS